MLGIVVNLTKNLWLKNSYVLEENLLWCILLNWWNIKLSSKYSSIPVDKTSFIPQEKLLWAVRSSSCRDLQVAYPENKCLWSAQPQIWRLFNMPFPQSLEEEEEMGLNARGQSRLLWNNVFWTWHGCCIDELTAAMVVCTSSSQKTCKHQWGGGMSPCYSWETVSSWWLLGDGVHTIYLQWSDILKKVKLQR